MLESINSPRDIKRLNQSQLELLCQEIRQLIIKKVSRDGGHLGSNLGMVEVSVALHYVFDSPKDKLIFDVSHQTYTHKILTGRREAFLNSKSLSRFSCYQESEHDIFSLGHSSSSISLACGLMKARNLRKGKENVIAVIGDGAMSGGLAFEGLNNATEIGGNLIVILNDNEMSIAENRGGIYRHLQKLRKSKGENDNNLFTALGFDYFYLEEGNDVNKLVELFGRVKDCDKPILLHIHTQKGCGLEFAENEKEKWHSVGAFNLKGELLTEKRQSYSTLTSEFLLERMKQESIVPIIAGTPSVMDFTKEKRDLAGENFVDVGICEEHAIAFGAALSKSGIKTVLGIYSTFCQRGYDQLFQEVALNNSPLTILLFGGSVYGYNHASHLGFFDIAMFSSLPNFTILVPSSHEEYIAMLEHSLNNENSPSVIRVPGVFKSKVNKYSSFDKLQYEICHRGEKVAILGLGSFFWLASDAASKLAQYGIDATLINPLFVGIDEKTLADIEKGHSLVVTLEDGIVEGGFGQKISAYFSKSDVKVLNYGLKKEFVDNFEVETLLKENRLTTSQIVEDILKYL